MKHYTTLLDTIAQGIALVTAFFIPLFFLPITTDFFELPKVAFLVIATSILLILWVIRLIINKEVQIVITPFTIPLFLLMLAYIVSLVVVAPNKVQSLTTPGSAGTIVFLFIWFFLITNLTYIRPQLQKYVQIVLAVSASFLALVTLLAAGGIFTRFQIPDLFKSPTFTPAGSPLVFLTITTVIAITTGAPLLIRLLMEDDGKERNLDTGHKSRFSMLKNAFGHSYSQEQTDNHVKREEDHQEEADNRPNDFLLGITTVIIFIGIAVAVYQTMTTAKPILLPQTAGWAVAVETLKQFKTALFGVGPSNFTAAFTQAKPATLNTTPMWNLRFSTSSNYLFHVFTEIGLLGLGALLLFIATLTRVTIGHLPHPEHHAYPLLLGSVAGIIIIFFLPANVTLLFLIFTFAALFGPHLKGTHLINDSSRILPSIIAVIVLLPLLPTLYLGGRAYAADMAFAQALTAIKNNNAQLAYNNNIQALKLNPFMDIYHITYAQTNMAIANGMAQQKNIDDKTRSTISQLIQQSIREAKAAIAANPTKAANWENLASTYRRIINIAQGAEKWTIQVYEQAIRLDPVNPILRLNLGGAFFSLGQYDDAINQFRIAVSLKPDFANGYYNLSTAYKEKGDYKNAVSAMKQVITYLPSDNPDFEKAQKELDELEKKAPSVAGAKTEGSLLTKPSTESAKLEPPLSLPSESAPPNTNPYQQEENTNAVTPTTKPQQSTPTPTL